MTDEMWFPPQPELCEEQKILAEIGRSNPDAIVLALLDAVLFWKMATLGYDAEKDSLANLSPTDVKDAYLLAIGLIKHWESTGDSQ